MYRYESYIGRYDFVTKCQMMKRNGQNFMHSITMIKQKLNDSDVFIYSAKKYLNKFSLDQMSKTPFARDEHVNSELIYLGDTFI